MAAIERWGQYVLVAAISRRREDVKTLVLYHKSAKTQPRYALQNALFFGRVMFLAGGPVTFPNAGAKLVRSENEQPLKITFTTYHS